MSRSKGRLHEEADRLRRLMVDRREVPRSEDVQALLELFNGLLDQIERDQKRLTRRQKWLESHLLSIENSLSWRLLRWPGRFLVDWRGRIGQLLLGSPLHPIYLKVAKPRVAEERYQLWVQREPARPEPPLQQEPLISVVLPVHNPKREWLEAAVSSVLEQTYSHWELCVCDDGSRDPWVAGYFAAKATVEPRIRFVRSAENLGISGACNRAGQLAQGAYVGFLDQDDLLSRHALYAIAQAVQDAPVDLLYTDEDYWDEDGRRVQPIFKPAFSPDLLHSCMYMGHFLVVRKQKLEQVGWFRSAFDGSQDYDLALRVTEQPTMVRHIPGVFYHWRRHPASTARRAAAKPFTHEAGKKALAEVATRQDPEARVQDGPSPNTYRVRWPVPSSLKASLVICSRNPKLLRRCLRELERNTSHQNRELVIVQHQNGSTNAIERLLSGAPFVRLPYAGPFNFSAMNNLGASRASGEVLVFLNDDVKPLTPEWLSELLAHARRPKVGPVGARLLYPSGAIQHAGMVIGIMQAAGHLHRDTFGAQYWSWLPFTRNVSAVTGACMAIRKRVFDELGGFDESFPQNFNDVDLCLRARQAGYSVIIEPAAVLRHHECQTRQPGVRFEERELLEERWGGWLERGDPFYSPYLSRTREDASLELDQWDSGSPR